MDIIINKKPVKVPLLPILAGISLLILVLTSFRLASIKGDEVGVFVNNLTGKVTADLTTGSKPYNGLYTDFYILKKGERTISMSRETNDQVRVKTGDGSDIEFDVEINYRMSYDAASVLAIVEECGLGKVEAYSARPGASELVDAYHEKWMREYSRSIVRHVFGELNPKTFYEADQRAAKAQQAADELNAALNPHGLTVTTVVPGDYTYYKEYKELIDEKKAADQDVDIQKQKAVTAMRDQERQIKEAEAVVKAETAKMEGTLRKELLGAEAEANKARLGVDAEAYQTRINAEAKLTQAKNNAEGQFALASAEAEGLKKLASSLSGEGGVNLVKMSYAQILRQARISGVPYATDPRIQKVELDTKNASIGRED